MGKIGKTNSFVCSFPWTWSQETNWEDYHCPEKGPKDLLPLYLMPLSTFHWVESRSWNCRPLQESRLIFIWSSKTCFEFLFQSWLMSWVWTVYVHKFVVHANGNFRTEKFRLLGLVQVIVKASNRQSGINLLAGVRKFRRYNIWRFKYSTHANYWWIISSILQWVVKFNRYLPLVMVWVHWPKA